MPSQGPIYFATGADDAGIGSTAWVNPGNAAGAPDVVYATAGLGPGGASHYLKLTNTGSGFSVPAGATVNGIAVVWTRKCGTGAIKDNAVRIVKGGAIGATDRADTVSSWPTSAGTATYGDPIDLWGETWTPADVNGTGFGCAISVQSPGMGDTASVDGAAVYVYYTDAAADSLPAAVTIARRPDAPTDPTFSE